MPARTITTTPKTTSVVSCADNYCTTSLVVDVDTTTQTTTNPQRQPSASTTTTQSRLWSAITGWRGVGTNHLEGNLFFYTGTTSNSFALAAPVPPPNADDDANAARAAEKRKAKRERRANKAQKVVSYHNRCVVSVGGDVTFTDSEPVATFEGHHVHFDGNDPGAALAAARAARPISTATSRT